jgi:3-hydroxyacyl-CoA dehydrogenase
MGYQIKKAAVIGSGTMGGGIAALLAGVGIPTTLLDIAPSELSPAEEAAGLSLDDKSVSNKIVEKGWKAVTRSRPPAILSEASKQLITLGNLKDDFDKLGEVDLIVEAIIENLEIKQDLFKRIDKVRAENCIVATNTSGLPIKAMVKGRSKGFQGHFLGMHFFNPPRWLKLLELIPHKGTLPEVLEFVTWFGEEVLGKGVVICKDTPNFIANRVFSITNTYQIAYALENGYSIEEVDGIAGELIGRPKTGVFRLLDLVGIDVAAHVGSNLYDLLPEDETREVLRNEANVKLLSDMVERKWLGNKTRVGFYKRVDTKEGKREFWVLNPKTLEHEPPQSPRFEIFGEGRKIEKMDERFRWLVSQVDNDEASEETRRLAKYIWDNTAYTLGYASRRVPEIADKFIDVDQAIKWGFMNEIGPFEIWDALGVEDTLQRMEASEIMIGAWVKEMLDAGCPTFYQYENGQAVGYYDLDNKAYTPLEVDARILPIANLKAPKDAVIKRNASASLIDMGDRVGLVEFHSKANALDQDIFEMVSHALDEAEADRFDALVIGNEGKHFSAGANIFLMWVAAQQGDFDQIDQVSKAMQDGLLRMRYFPKPIVAAPFGMTLAGGAEVTMACSKRVASAETIIGLVEVAIGLIPAGTGTKELLRRVVNPVMRVKNADPISVIEKVFETIFTAKTAVGAHEAFELGFFQPGDRIVMNKDYLLTEAKRSALAMIQEGYRPPVPEMIYAAGRDVLAAVRSGVWGFEEAGWASEHDALVGNKLAWVVCGGDITEPTWVPEQYILDLERKVFVDLAKEEKTQERMGYMLEHNKPLRN